MNDHVRRPNRRNILPFILMVVVFLGGCASTVPQKQSEAAPAVFAPATPPEKKITAIKTAEDAESVHVVVTGSSVLTYTSVKQPLPLGVVLYFKETGMAPGVVMPLAENAVISSIEASELTTNGLMSRVEIVLKEDAAYTITQEDGGLKISFPKSAVSGKTLGQSPKVQKTELASHPSGSTVALGADATKLHAVSATMAGQSTLITITADGAIRNYKSFTLENPPRIVFELFGLASPFDGEQALSVKSSWVKKVRHYSSPEKLRVVIDTTDADLARFSAWPSETGLLIRVGEESQRFPSDGVGGKMLAAEKSGAVPVAASAHKPGWVNRIDFSSEENGKSTILIGTTEPVEYTMKKAGERLLHLTLKNTRLPDYRERPLITNRFQSAVDQIVPTRKSGQPENTLFAVELRESVPYFVEQQDRLLLVHFEASSVPPQPMAQKPLPVGKERDTAQEGIKLADVNKKAENVPAERHKEMPVSSGKKYGGEKIALDFYETDIKNVFRILKEVSGKNFAIDNDVSGKVTLSFETPVPWDQVLDLILKMNQLGKIEDDNIIRIGTVATLKKEEDDRQAALAAQQKAIEQAVALEPLVTEYISVSYAKAKEEVLPHLEKIITKDRGNVTVDDRGNQIIFTDVAEKVKHAIALVKQLDAVTPQVIIEARVVEVNSNFSSELGIDWGASQGPVQKNFLGGAYNWDVAMNFPSAAEPSIGFNFKRIAGTPLELNARLNAIESRDQGKIISAPKIVTLDNKKAKIKQGVEVSYLERDDAGGSSVKFKNVDLLLEVTPHVTPDKRVSMSIFITKNDIAGTTTEGTPVLSTNEAQTELLVNDGDTIVIGGILKKNKTTGTSNFPGLSEVPGLSWLFKEKKTTDSTGELLIFITPQIVQLAQR
ncbi:MAG: type IV pilus secretin PilQ [Pseudomonadota bacterium]